MHFPMGKGGLVLAFVLACTLLHMGRFRVFKFIFVTYLVSMLYPVKKILFVLYRAFSHFKISPIYSDLVWNVVRMSKISSEFTQVNCLKNHWSLEGHMFHWF